MKVWLGYAVSADFEGVEKTVERVFDSEDKARAWTQDPQFLEHHNQDFDWREYEPAEVE